MKCTVIAGARPNFMKVAPIVRAFEAIGCGPRLVHTGQHYDERMSQTFFDELSIPTPDANLGVGSGTPVGQLAEMMVRLETDFRSYRPDIVLVVGDVNSTLAAAITANKLSIPVAHVEAGLRSFDREMPEEINRVLTDAVSDFLFTSEPSAAENLQREGIPASRIHFSGNVMIDTLMSHLDRARALRFPEQFGVEGKDYAVLTLHRPSNVDDREHLTSILNAIEEISDHLPVIFPVHPRTRSRLQEFGLLGRAEPEGLRLIEPLGYLAMTGLVDGARLVLTDSGGLQEETTALRVPCLTLRENTERPVTVTAGSNHVVGWHACDILAAFQSLLDSPDRIGQVPERWDGWAAERIVSVLVDAFDDRIPATTAERADALHDEVPVRPRSASSPRSSMADVRAK